MRRAHGELRNPQAAGMIVRRAKEETRECDGSRASEDILLEAHRGHSHHAYFRPGSQVPTHPALKTTSRAAVDSSPGKVPDLRPSSW